MQDFKSLLIWKKSFELNKKIYKITKHFPEEEIYGLTSQIRRSSISISSNIAEGCGRKTNKDFSNFLHNSFGSLKELECQILISESLNYISKEELEKIQTEISELTAMIIGLIKKITRTSNS
ncbi:four helix bundle protein [archaeon]|nr:four helix bundle protein [archaeon]